jgi:hypothetical protein
LKRGKLSEQVLAAEVIMLTLIQLGYSNEATEFLSESKTALTEIIEGEENDPEIRAMCVKCLGLAIFITNENSADTISILDKFEALFSRSYLKGFYFIKYFLKSKTLTLCLTCFRRRYIAIVYS